MLPGSWLGQDPSNTASEQPVTSQKRSALSSEYKRKFRPFSDYCYVDGQFSGARDAVDGEAQVAAGHASGQVNWYEEVVELRKKASSYKVRGWGQEMAEPHLAHLYSRKEDDPTALAERKIISALYLETLKPGFVREERGRSPVTRAGSGVRQQSHPPPSSRKSPGATKMALKLHTAEGGKRPHSAQPSSERPAGDAVDRAKGRSPATPRTPTSKPTSATSAPAKVIKKRPSTERPAPTAEKPTRPAAEKSDKLVRGASADTKQARQTSPEKAHKPARASTAKHGKPEKASKPEKTEKTPRAAPELPPSGTPESGKGIRGGTPRSRSAHRLAASKAKSPTKADASAAPGPAMSASAPSESARELIKTDAKQIEPAAGEAKTGEPDGVAEPPVAADVDQEKQEEIIRSAPEPTRVKSPDGMAPIKSPEPVNWTVPLDTGKTFTVTQNVMAGHSSPQSSRGEGLRSPGGEDPARSPYQRAVTDVSHLRNGELAESPLTHQHLPHSNGDDPDVRDLTREPETRHGAARPTPTTADDAMSASMHGDQLRRPLHDDSAEDTMSRSFQAGDDRVLPSVGSDDALRSPDDQGGHGGSTEETGMTESFHADRPDTMQRSFHAMENPMAVSMTADDLKQSFNAEDAETAPTTENDRSHPLPPLQDPMTISMTGEDLQRSFHAPDPMTASMTGEDLKRSFHEDTQAVFPTETASETLGPTARILDEPFISSSSGRPPLSGDLDPEAAQSRSGLFSVGSAEPVAKFTSSLFTSGSAEPAQSVFSSGSAAPAPSMFSSGPAAPAPSMFSSGSAAPPAVFSAGSAAPASGMFSSGSAAPSDPLSSGTAEPPAHPPGSFFSAGSAQPASSLFSAGSAGPPRFSTDLFSSTGRQAAEAKSDATKGTYRVI